MVRVSTTLLVAFTLLATTPAFAQAPETTSTAATTVASGAPSVTTATSASTSNTAPKLVSTASGSVTLSWDALPTASAYIVKYGTTSVASSTDPNAQYTDQTDPVAGTGTTITGLQNSTYYFALVTVDDKGNESDTFSDELKAAVGSTAASAPASASTSASGATTTTASDGSFAVVSAKAVDTQTLSVTFSDELSSDPISVRVTKTSDNSDVTVDAVTPDSTDPKKAAVSLVGILQPSTAYTVTIVSAKNKAGAPIQTGVKGTSEFQTPATLTEVPLNAAPASTGATTGTGTPAVLAANSQKAGLPATGAREDFLVIVSLLIAVGIVARRRSTVK